MRQNTLCRKGCYANYIRFVIQVKKRGFMIKFPVKCEVKATATEGIRKSWNAQAGSLPVIISAIPPEFLGPGGGYSPEDLFALALLNCIIATFKVYCEKSKLSFVDLKSRAILTADQQPSENLIWMKHVEVFVDVTGSSDPEKVRRQLENSIKDCAVSNSIKSGKTFHLSVS
jgi:uncharacterized OsmC-like protein